MIKLQNIKVVLGDKVIIEDFSADFPQNGIVTLEGASGVGKTTLLRVIMGLTEITSGKITKDEIKFSAVFQEDRLLPSFSALENAKLCGTEEKALELMTLFGLGDKVHLPVHKLSGGQQRRVAIIRAINSDFDVLVLDEPFKGIDDKARINIYEQVLGISNKNLVIIVSHESLDDVFSKQKSIQLT